MKTPTPSSHSYLLIFVAIFVSLGLGLLAGGCGGQDGSPPTTPPAMAGLLTTPSRDGLQSTVAATGEAPGPITPATVSTRQDDTPRRATEAGTAPAVTEAGPQVTERSTPGGELVDPSDILSAVEALRGCVDAYLVTGNFEEAIATISAAIELQPDNPVLYADRGYAYLQMDEPRKAADDFARVIDLAPLIPVGYLGRGLSYVAIQSPRAFADLDKAIELGARDGYWYRGIAWYFVDEPEKALEDVRVYIEQAPDGQYAGEARLLEKRLLDYIALRESQRKIREEGQ